MLRMAEILGVRPEVIEAVAKELRSIKPNKRFNALSSKSTHASGVIRIKPLGKTHLFLLSEDFSDHLPLVAKSCVTNWTGECP